MNTNSNVQAMFNQQDSWLHARKVIMDTVISWTTAYKFNVVRQKYLLHAKQIALEIKLKYKIEMYVFK